MEYFKSHKKVKTKFWNRITNDFKEDKIESLRRNENAYIGIEGYIKEKGENKNSE